jgi:hypothetical protein
MDYIKKLISILSIFSIALLFLLISGCAFTYELCNKGELQSNRLVIERLNNLLTNQPLNFLSELKLDTIHLAHDIIPLGLDYTYESGAFRYNDQIYFWCQIIRQGESIVSFSTSPFAWKLGPSGWAAYSSIFEEYGWEKKSYFSNDFENRTYNYQATLVPVAGAPLRRHNISSIDSIMSPYYGVIFKVGPTQSYHETIVKSFAVDDSTIQYLLYSQNPVTRMLAIRNINCSNINVSETTRNRMQYLIKSSPKVKTIYADMLNSSDLQNLIDCNKNFYRWNQLNAP